MIYHFGKDKLKFQGKHDIRKSHVNFFLQGKLNIRTSLSTFRPSDSAPAHPTSFSGSAEITNNRDIW